MDCFRFNYVAKQTCATLGFPQIVSIMRGVENLRQRWYVDGIACIRFNHRVPMIMLYDAGRSTTRNSAIFSMVPGLTVRLIDPRAIVVSPESPTSGLGFSAILDGSIFILSRVFLKIILAELSVSIRTLATSMFYIVNSMTRRSLRGLVWLTVALSLKEMTSVSA